MAKRMTPEKRIMERMTRAGLEFRAAKAQVDSMRAEQIKKMGPPSPPKRRKVAKYIPTRQEVA